MSLAFAMIGEHLMSFALRILAFVFLAIMIIELFGAAVFALSMTGEEMTTCPLMHGVAICPMNPLQHLEEWEALFAAIVPAGFLLLSMIALLPFVRLASHFDALQIQDLGPPRETIFPTPARNYLQEALADGIVHPKRF